MWRFDPLFRRLHFLPYLWPTKCSAVSADLRLLPIFLFQDPFPALCLPNPYFKQFFTGRRLLWAIGSITRAIYHTKNQRDKNVKLILFDSPVRWKWTINRFSKRKKLEKINRMLLKTWFTDNFAITLYNLSEYNVSISNNKSIAVEFTNYKFTDSRIINISTLNTGTVTNNPAPRIK